MCIAFVEPIGHRWRVTLLTLDEEEEVCTTCTVSRCGEAMAIASTFTTYAAELYARRRRERLH